MDKKLLDVLYIKHDVKYGILSENKNEVVKHILGTDLTLVERKQDGNVFLLVPLTKVHKIECHVTTSGSDSISVDGKVIKSGNFFRKDACQWIEIDNETLSKVA